MDFSPSTLQRIADSVHVTEHLVPWGGPRYPLARTYEQPDRLHIFQLQAALAIGGTADAYPWVWSAASGSYAADTTAKVKVTDTLHSFSAPTKTLVACRFVGKADCSVVREVLQTFFAKLIRVSLTTGATPSIAANATFTPTSLAVMFEGQDPTSGGASMPVVTNYSAAIQAAGGNVSGIVCAWDAGIPGYRVIDGPC